MRICVGPCGLRLKVLPRHPASILILSCECVNMTVPSFVVTVVCVTCADRECVDVWTLSLGPMIGGPYSSRRPLLSGVLSVAIVVIGLLSSVLVRLWGPLTAVEYRTKCGEMLQKVVTCRRWWTMPVIRELKILWQRRILLTMMKVSDLKNRVYPARRGRTVRRSTLGPSIMTLLRACIVCCVLVGALLLKA